jgi:hypothetical protein
VDKTSPRRKTPQAKHIIFDHKVELLNRARTFKCLWGPGIDSKE